VVLVAVMQVIGGVMGVGVMVVGVIGGVMGVVGVMTVDCVETEMLQ